MKPFAVTWDYRCPFARNAHEHIVAGLADGADWDVTFLPFTLSQGHVPEGGTPVWDDPARAADLMALAAGVVARDQYPEQFGAVHLALFAARHDDGLDLRVPGVLAAVLDGAGVPGEKVLAEVEGGAPIQEIRRAYEQATSEWSVWGVPTFISEGRAVFVRLMSRPRGDAALARRTIDRVVGLMEDEPDLNEFKYTTLSN
ncbi:MAG TPA: DsbA family protein [Acidimicrobiales bacterium]|jgi:hypothetical protein